MSERERDSERRYVSMCMHDIMRRVDKIRNGESLYVTSSVAYMSRLQIWLKNDIIPYLSNTMYGKK